MQAKKTLKSIVSLLLIVTMIVQLLPTNLVKAANEPGNGEGNNCTVTLKLAKGETEEGVTMPKGSSVPVGTKIARITSPVKKGYLFKGWYYDENSENYAYPDDTITGDLTLYRRIRYQACRIHRAGCRTA